MTLEEAIKHAEEKARCGGKCGEDHAQLAEWLKELQKLRTVKTEERKEESVQNVPKEDLIFRKAAIDAHYEYCNKHPDAGFPVWSLKILEDLPSAQPERKTGKWLPDTRTFEMMFVCSECKASLHVDTINLKPSWDYCPNCGSFNGGEGECG